MSRGRADGARVLVAHPSPDLYGSDWQLVETIHGLIETGHEVLVALPQDGPLVAVLRNAGARVAVMPFTVLRKALLSPTGLAKLSAQAAPEVARLRAVIRASRAEAVLTNTVTIPWWPVAASAAGVPVLAHVHEAEDTQRRIIRAGLNAPLLAASRIVANSGAACADSFVRPVGLSRALRRTVKCMTATRAPASRSTSTRGPSWGRATRTS